MARTILSSWESSRCHSVGRPSGDPRLPACAAQYRTPDRYSGTYLVKWSEGLHGGDDHWQEEEIGQRRMESTHGVHYLIATNAEIGDLQRAVAYVDRAEAMPQ